MDLQEQQKPQTTSACNPYLLRLKCFLCQAPNPNGNDENNNLKKANNSNENPFNPLSKLPLYTCPDCEAKIRSEENATTKNSIVNAQEFENRSDRILIAADSSSDDDDEDDGQCLCPSCGPSMNDEYDSKSRELWDHLAHVVKCLYRATDRDFSENHLFNEIRKAKKCVKKLTKLSAQTLFNKLESIVLDYVREIRKQVLERFHTCSKTSHDVQLFISFLLDEYNLFIQAATHVSTILSHLEEHYMRSFHLTWLLYNKHLYEELIYMDRKIHHSMTTMIDLLQPSNDDNEDYSPAEYTQLLNRFLAFDEEMSEIACLYKDSQAKMISTTLDAQAHNGHPTEINGKSTETHPCKKVQRSEQSQSSPLEDVANSLTTTAVDIPLSNNSSSTPVPPQQGSNGSSVGSGIGGDESSSVSSIDDHLLDNDTSSSGYTQEEQEELARLLLDDDDMNEQLLQEILNSVSPLAQIQHEIDQSLWHDKQLRKMDPATIADNEEWIRRIIQEIPVPCSQGQKITTNEIPTDIHSTTHTEQESSNAFASSSPSRKSSLNKSKSQKSSSSSSRRRKDASTPANPPATVPLNSSSQVPRKSIAADLLLPRSIADLSAQIQSVSFTAGTFGSITSTQSNDCGHSASGVLAEDCASTTMTAAKTTTVTGQTRLSINLTRKPGFKAAEHGGQKIAEALFNELTSINHGESPTRECSSGGRKKDNLQFKKNKQQRSAMSNDTLLKASCLDSANVHPFFGSATKSESNASSTAYNNLDHLLRHAASNTDVSEAALQSILSSFHSPSCLDPLTTTAATSASSSSKHSISSKTTEALQALLAQQQYQHHHHHHHQKRASMMNSNNKRCEFCCCEFAEGRSCSSSHCLHLPSTGSSGNGGLSSCVTCMALPGATTTTTTSVMGTMITGGFNQRDVGMKERLKLKFKKRVVQNLSEQQSSIRNQQKKEPDQQQEAQQKKTLATNKKSSSETHAKTREFQINDKNDIDDLVRFIDGNETTSSSNCNQEHATASAAAVTTGESTSKKNKKKKEKQTKVNVKHDDVKVDAAAAAPSSQEQQPLTIDEKKDHESNIEQHVPAAEPTSRSVSSSSSRTTTAIAKNACVANPEPILSKRQLKAKLKLERQQEQMERTGCDGLGKVSDASNTATACATAVSMSETVRVLPSPSASHEVGGVRSNVDLTSDTCDLPEEEEQVNWITISRKQSKHKPTPSSVPSLLAAPVLPVVLLNQSKQQRQPSAVGNAKKVSTPVQPSSLAQQKTTPSTATTTTTTTATTAANKVPSNSLATMSKQSQGASASLPRSQNTTRNYLSQQSQKVDPAAPTTPQAGPPQPPINLWKTHNIHEHTSVVPSVSASSIVSSSNLLATAPSYIPTQSLASTLLSAPTTATSSSSSTAVSSDLTSDLTSSVNWNGNGYLLATPPPPSSASTALFSSPSVSSLTPGPVQRPHASFSPAPGSMNHSASRCIQRPSPEPRSSASNTAGPFSLYFPLDYSMDPGTSVWSDGTGTTSQESSWNYPQDQPQFGSSISSNDFPLYDPFHSGTGLTIPSSMPKSLLTNEFSDRFPDLCDVSIGNVASDFDPFEKEIEAFTKFCFEHDPLETREKVPLNVDRYFVRQA